MNYGDVLSRAWQIIWKHKALWIFGILAGCGSAGGSGPQNSVSYSFGGGEDLPPWLQNLYFQFQNLSDSQLTLILIAGALLLLAFIILAVFLSTMGRIGLYRGTQLADQGEGRLPFGELFREGLPYFWRVFLLNLLIGLAFFVLVILFTGAAILGTAITLGLIWLCLLPLICLLIPLGWLASIWIEQANIAVVIEDLGISAALRRGWEVFRGNLGPMIVMGLILFLGIGLIGGIIISLPLLLVGLPALVGFSLSGETVPAAGLMAAGLCLVLYLPVLILLAGILQSYIQAAWTLTYLRLTGKAAAMEPLVEGGPLA